MTLLEGNLWLTFAPQRAPSGGAKPGDGGYPPYNIELLGNGEALRITLAVAGFRLDELEVSVGVVRTLVHRLRKRYTTLVRAEVARTVSDPGDIDEELHALCDALIASEGRLV